MDRGAAIGVSDDHLALRETVRRWTTAHCPPAAARATLDADGDGLPPFWDDLRGRGWLGVHVAEDREGEGFGLLELAVVLEELGRACAPGPFLPTVLAAAALDRFGVELVASALVPELASGRRIGAVGFGCPPVPAEAAPGATETETGAGPRAELHGRQPVGPGGLVVSGTWEPVLGGGLADVLVLPVVVSARASGRRADAGPEGETWVVVDVDELEIQPISGPDRSRRAARAHALALTVPATRVLRCPAAPAGVDGLAAALVAAESVGVAAWCVETAAEHAKVREQFGRPIGQFQAVKHRCADMLGAVELARAAAWDACRAGDPASQPLALATAGSLAPDAAYRCAKDCIQVLGGIGFTWEHDAHLYLKRAMANRLLLGGPARWRSDVARLALGGMRRDAGLELPPEAEVHRREVGSFLEELRSQDKLDWNRRLADSGYLVPHWPRPWGRDASPLEQLVVEEEFRRARVRRPHLGVGTWALPAIIVHGHPAQQERFVPPTMRGEITWCQMFSEPGAGSDLASLSTKAVRVAGGWRLTGQKVWTSMAQHADWGICLGRTDPAAARHQGIGCFLVDMASEGIEVRPLRELTGAALFNEVFLSDVFVPDDCVVGEPTAGWSAARTTLANERVSMGRGSSMGPGLEALVELAARQAAGALEAPDDPRVLDTLGELVAATQALAAMGTRMTLRAFDGAAPGPEASIRKLLGVELDQRVQEVGLDLLGRRALVDEDEAEQWVGGFLANRSLSIAGGTSEIQRNVIAERLLGLPRDP